MPALLLLLSGSKAGSGQQDANDTVVLGDTTAQSAAHLESIKAVLMDWLRGVHSRKADFDSPTIRGMRNSYLAALRAHGITLPTTLEGDLRNVQPNNDALKFIAVVFLAIIVGVILHYSRKHMLVKLSVRTVKGNCNGKKPKWVDQVPVMPPNEDPLEWDRANLAPSFYTVSPKVLRVTTSQERPFADGVVANRGFTKGKHVFAFMWPKDQKVIVGAYISIGFGYRPQNLQPDENDMLVGGQDRKAMGFDLIQNRLLFYNREVCKYPPGKPSDFCAPTLVYMYVDLDESKISFGSEDEFWGTAFSFNHLRKSRNTKMYAMVATKGVVGKLMMFYKGQVSDVSDNIQKDDTEAKK